MGRVTNAKKSVASIGGAIRTANIAPVITAEWCAPAAFGKVASERG
jgi:hypothetical protein